MVAKMMRWRPWPPLTARKFRVRLVVRRVEGVAAPAPAPARVTAEVRWKGRPRAALGPLRRTVRRNCTREEEVMAEKDDGESREEAEQEEEGRGFGERVPPWELSFVVFNGANQGSKNKASILGTATLNLAEYASTAKEEIEIKLPLVLPGVTTESPPSLHISLNLLELRLGEETSEAEQRPIVPAPLSPSSGDGQPAEKDELSALKAGLRKVKIFRELVSTRKPKKTCGDDEGSEGKCSARSEEVEQAYPFDTDSMDDDLDEGEIEEGKEYEDWVYYSHRRSDVGYSRNEETAPSVQEQSVSQASKRSIILPWRKRKLGFRSPKTKGEPLLKKAYGEEGGDDIDYDRRVLSSSDESLSALKQKDEEGSTNHSSVSEFGDDNFVIGSWETKEIVSRDGHMKLSTQVFFASIDQRSERAAGESACTALVAVIADWLHNNPNMMPIKSQFDSLIRDGSLEWRSLCDNQSYRERFPDKHFDLETVLHANVRPLSVNPSKSFIGFFHPEGTEDSSGFEFLHGAMSFDCIWDEISRDGGPECLYIVSWNDHFFVLKVERDAYYIIDTLGERLYEGCDQAYILKFDASTSIRQIPSEEKTANSDSNGAASSGAESSNSKGEDDGENSAVADGELVCEGKESCKEYIKSFLAAIPIRELLVDIKKGLMASATPLHHRLQIELHYTDSSKETNMEFPLPIETGAALTVAPAVAV
uniref:C2 NT-type domain-containing protein n=1 Tax=Ananas comosus var. bracteatus TaxID=296719 RepID=A0A6V7QEK6_ANACO|nr:unnamed protein product [Ananas comosus var. bracteatus]